MAAQPLRPRAVYMGHALSHPCQLLVCTCLPFALILGLPLPAIGTFVVVEIVLLGFVSNTETFRRRVDKKVFAARCAAAAKERAYLLAQMLDVHRDELVRLEVLADAIRQRLAPDARAAASIDDYLGLDHLLAMYVHRAITYCAGTSCLATSSRETLEAQIGSLTAAAACAKTSPARSLAAGRLDVARMRAARWRRSCEELQCIEGQLALIADLVRLTHEQSFAPVSSDALKVDIECALVTVRESQRTATELAMLFAENVVPDPTVLRMGRQTIAGVTLPPNGAPTAVVDRLRVVADAAITSAAPLQALADAQLQNFDMRVSTTP